MALRPDNAGSISKDAQDFLQSLPPFEVRPQPPLDGSAPAWRAFQKLAEERARPACERALLRHHATVAEAGAGPLRTLFISPEGVKEDAIPALYMHGGGYTCYSARSSLFASIPLAVALNRPLISIDYPLAPQSGFADTVPITAAALAALLQRFPGASLIGESAGGGLALSVVNRLAPQRISPRCLVLISPWTDLGDRPDSRKTLAANDPILQYEPGLRVCAEAYARGACDNPVASPLLADYDDLHPPSFILCGSEEILLSDSLDLHEKLTAARAKSLLEVWDGMFHSFPILAAHLPESERAMRSIKAFVDHFD